MQSHLADIDELVLKCRDDEARKYISEAVASYKVGAFRACIVMTWIAVLYDFLYKLRELKLAGDKQAQKKLEEFEEARSNPKNYPAAQRFENSILESAYKEFEFITFMQFEDLEHLNKDRNRCAHPSMIVEDEIYQPTAEQARNHLRNVVMYLLQYPPTQSRAHLDALIQLTEMYTFPTDLQKVAEIFRVRMLDRSRDSFIRDFVYKSIERAVLEDIDFNQFQRSITALQAMREIRYETVSTAMEKFLPKIAIKVPDEELYKVISFLQLLPDTYTYLTSDFQVRLETYIEKREDPSELADAINLAFSKIDDLRTSAETRISTANYTLLTNLVERAPRQEYVSRALELYEHSQNFDAANNITVNILIPLVESSNPVIDRDAIERIVWIAENMSQPRGSNRLRDLLFRIRDVGVISADEYEQIIRGYPSISQGFASSLFPDESQDSDEYEF